MKSKLTFLFITLTQILSAQNFTEVLQFPPLDSVTGSSVAFSDVDGDSDSDVLISGINGSNTRISKLYTNDGRGNFTEAIGTSFEGVSPASIAFSDVDRDGDPDVLITGTNNSLDRISKLYINSGNGNFTEVMGTPFEGVSSYSSSAIAFSDVDIDGDPDVLITGYANSYYRTSKLYINNGGGIFTEAMGIPFDGVDLGSVAFSDVDGDGDPDVLITGLNSSNAIISKLYINNGRGNFTEAIGTPFDGVTSGSIGFSDVDGDSDPDLLITGMNIRRISKLYINNGRGSFTESTGAPFEGVSNGSIAFSDVDGDGDSDVLITGITNYPAPTSKLYINDGRGNFTKTEGMPFESVFAGSIAFSDIDGDGDPDVLITGVNNSDVKISKLYTNNGMVSSTNEVDSLVDVVFTLYPNPTKANNLNISYETSDDRWITVSVFNLNGRLLSQQQRYFIMGQHTFSIDITSLSIGSYIIQLDDGKRKESHKVVVE